MELIQLVSCFALIIIPIMLLSIVTTKPGNRSKATNLPPGPWKLPLIGSLHHLATNIRSPLHQTFYELSKTYGPLMHLKLGVISTYIVSSPQAAKSAIKTHDRVLADRINPLAVDIFGYNNSGVIFTPCNDQWRQVRRICVSQLLTNKKIKSLQSFREQEVLNLIALIKKSEGLPMNLSAKLTSLSSTIMWRALLGEKIGDEEYVIGLMTEALTLIGGFDFTDIFPSLQFLAFICGTKSKVLSTHNKIDKLLDGIIKKHQDQYHHPKISKQDHEDHEEDILHVLLRIQQQNEPELPITEKTIKAILCELYVAGTDSTASTIEWAMAELIKNPRVMKKAQTELRSNRSENEVPKHSYLEMVIRETLRLHPAIPLIPKLCKEACEIYGYVIPKGSWVVVNLWAIGRDPDIWNDAESFIPERYENHKVEYNDMNHELIPFGGGRRLCPGKSFALVLIELVLAQLLYHVDWELLDDLKPEKIDMDEIYRLVARKKKDLYLIPNFYTTNLI